MKQMRVVPGYEKKKRGCDYCQDKQRVREGKCFRTACPHDECPYHVLDKYKTYEDFMESEDSKILVDEFFSSVPTNVELASQTHTIKRIFSDGDSMVGV